MPYFTAGLSEAAVEHLADHLDRFVHDPPVQAVRRYRRDAVIEKIKAVAKPAKGAIRGDISEFSFRSRLRLLFFAKNCDCDFFSMLTLTYPREWPADGRRVKRDLDAMQKFLKRGHGVRGIWFLEFQKRGAPHFHLLLDLDLSKLGPLVLKRRTRFAGHASDCYETHQETETAFAESWYRIVGSRDLRHLAAGVALERLETSDAALRYCAAHAAKPRQKEVPVGYLDVGRFWGRIGRVSVVEVEPEPMTTEEVLRLWGTNALSSKGGVKKYIFDHATTST